MYGIRDADNPWNISGVMDAAENLTEYGYYDGSNDVQDEESMDEAEIEALLYSQIYFEKNDNEEEVQPDTGYDVIVREEKDDKSNVCSAFASIVNFSGRSYMSEVKTPLNLATEDESKGTSTCEWSERTLGNAKSALKKLLGKISGHNSAEEENASGTSNKLKVLKKGSKKKKLKEKVMVLSDSGESYVEEVRHKKKNNRKRKKKKADKLLIKKVKKDDIVVLDSCSDTRIMSDVSDSDSDVMMLGGLSGDEDLGDLDLNIAGAWRTFRDPQRVKTPDLSSVDLSTWDGSPVLTLEEVSSLLGACDWKLNDDDRYGLLRTYGGSNIRCRNCNEKGHLMRDCPKPKKVQKCALCGMPGHFYRRCPNTLCFNCDLPGHVSRDCPTSRKSWNIVCKRCGYYGHMQNCCSELWRQYHISTNHSTIVEGEQKDNKAVFCYNCGHKGHFGDECDKERLNEYVQPVSTFITYYGSSQPMQYSRQGQDSSQKTSTKKKKKKNKEYKATDYKVVVPSLKGQGKTWTSKSKEKQQNRKLQNNQSIQPPKQSNQVTIKKVNKVKRKEKKKTRDDEPGTSFRMKSEVKKLTKSMKKVKKTPFDAEVDNFPRSKNSNSYTKKTEEIDQGTIFDTEFGEVDEKKPQPKRKTKSKKKAKKVLEPIVIEDKDVFSNPAPFGDVLSILCDHSDEDTAVQQDPVNVLSLEQLSTSELVTKGNKQCNTPGESSRKHKKADRKENKQYEDEVFVIDDDDSDDDVEIISSTMPTGTNIIPGIVSWWDKDEKDDTTQFDPNFKNILKGSFEHMSSSSRSNFQARLTRASPNMRLRSGRKLVHRDESSENKSTSIQHNRSAPGRRRKKGNGAKKVAIPIGVGVEPIPESNIGNRLLRGMGWKPGTGLGVDGSGMTTPIIATILPYRSGLGDLSLQTVPAMPTKSLPVGTTSRPNNTQSLSSKTQLPKKNKTSMKRRKSSKKKQSLPIKTTSPQSKSKYLQSKSMSLTRKTKCRPTKTTHPCIKKKSMKKLSRKITELTNKVYSLTSKVKSLSSEDYIVIE